ncbi:hypothetical protein MKX01_009280 [Papaver californicum]|nr:hypothetical protein MKX01_009280 [Papaver californicum]
MEYSNVNHIVFLVLILFILITGTQFISGEKESISRRDETKFGDTIDCINIYKQPAFDHPLLKDHKIQMGLNIDNGFQNKRCPSGTVSIRRTKKEDLVNAQYLLQKANPIHTNAYTLSPMNHHFVSVEEFSDGKTYFEGAANISLHGLELDNNQFSTGQIWIQNGPTEEINSIESGWMIYPTLFGDNRSRLFGYWTADGGKQTGCFNVLCSGFVQVSSEIPLGAVMEHVSIYGAKTSWALPLQIYRDSQTGNWWLITMTTTKIIGYWPNEIFTHLANNASTIRYGGIAGAKHQTPTPPMGNGYLPRLDDYSKTAFIARMKYVNEKGQYVGINTVGVQTKHDTSLDCYNSLFAGDIGGVWEIAMAFGGPGGMCP